MKSRLEAYLSWVSGKAVVMMVMLVSVCLGMVIPFLMGMTRRLPLHYEGIEVQISFTFLCFLVVGICWIVAYGITKDPLPPAGLMGVAWLVPLSFHSLQLAPSFLDPLTVRTWLLIIGAFLGFFTGTCVPFAKSLERREEVKGSVIGSIPLRCGTSHVQRSPTGNIYRREPVPQLLRLIYTSFVVGLVVYIINVFLRGGITGIPILSNNPEEARWHFLLPVWGQLTILMQTACIMAWAYSFFFRQITRSLLTVMVVPFIVLFASAGRNDFFGLLEIVFFVYYYLRRPPIRKVVSVTLLLGLVMYSVLQIHATVRRLGTIAERMVLRGEVVFLAPQLAYPYNYLTTNITNMQLAFQHFRNYTYGLKTFFPILSWMQLYESSDVPGYIAYLPGGISASLGDFYMDFGIMGVIALPFILGILSGLSHKIFCSTQGYFALLFLAVLSSCVLMSGFANWFSQGRVWIILVSLAAFSRVVRVRRESR